MQEPCMSGKCSKVQGNPKQFGNLMRGRREFYAVVY